MKVTSLTVSCVCLNLPLNLNLVWFIFVIPMLPLGNDFIFNGLKPSWHKSRTFIGYWFSKLVFIWSHILLKGTSGTNIDIPHFIFYYLYYGPNFRFGGTKYLWFVNVIRKYLSLVCSFNMFRKLQCHTLTSWGQVKHLCISKLTIIGSDNGLSPSQRQANIWTNAGISLIWTLGSNFSEILTKIRTYSFKKMHLKMSSVEWQQICCGLIVSTQWPTHEDVVIISKV